MTISLRMLLTADGKQAVAETNKLQVAAKGAAASVQSIGTAGKKSISDRDRFQGQISLAGAKLNRLKTAQLGVALSSQKMAGANRLATGSVANMAAQFNDIGVMLAAGQNPLQLALQQGTQITQAFGPGGAAGALKLLRAGFVSMINPVSLATIGIIAGGAALIQWGMSALSAGEDTDTLKEAIESLGEEAEDARTKVELFLSGARNKAELSVLKQIALVEGNLAATRAKIEAAGPVTRQNADVVSGYERAAQAAEAELARLREILALTDKQVSQAERLQRIQERANRAGAAYVRRLEAEAKARSEAVSELNTLRDQVALNRLIVQFGEESAAVTRLRAQQERAAFVEATNARNVSEELKQQLIAAYDAANSLANTDMASGISGAAAEATRLARQLGISFDLASRITSFGPQGTPQVDENGLVYSGRGGNPLTQGGRAIDVQTAAAGTFLANYKEPKKPRASGGKSAAENIKDLTDRLQLQLDVLRETDPVQKQMIQNRETLASATTAQRDRIEDLIQSYAEEAAALERKEALWGLVSSAATNFLDGIFDRGKKAIDVVKDLAASLLDAYIQGQLLGTGPFGGGGGGLLGLIFPSLAPEKKAEGGMIYGPGGPRDDRVPIWASNGEMMINAAATARHRPLLEMINAGAPVRAFADGGAIDGSRYGAVNGPANVNAPLQVNMNVSGARGDREIEEAGYRGMQRALDEYDRQVLPRRVASIQSNPRMVG